MQFGLKLLTTTLLAIVFIHGALLAHKQLVGEIRYQVANTKSGLERKSGLEGAVATNPLRAEYRTSLAHSEMRLGRPLHAHKYLIQDVVLRPSWPYAWNRLVEWNTQVYGYSDELEGAFDQSVKLSEHSFYLIWRRAVAAFELMEMEIPLPMREKLVDALSRALYVRGGNTLGHAFLSKKEGVICGAFPDSEEVQTWCEGVRKYRENCRDEKELPRASRSWCERTRKYWTVKARAWLR